MSLEHHVYVVTHRESKRHYVGKTSVPPERRWKQHVGASQGKRRPCVKFHRALEKYGPEAFDFQVIETFPTEAEALYFEAWWIEYLRTTIPECGFNIFRDGTGGLGHAVSEEARAKLRAANLGKKYGPETKAKLSAMRKGKKFPPRSAEWSRKISEARKREIAEGRRVSPTLGGHSEAAKAKMRKPKTLTEEQRKANSERAKVKLRRLWADPEFRKRHSERMKARLVEAWKDPEYRERMTKVNRENNQARRK